MSGLPLNIDFQQILLHLFLLEILFAIVYFLIYRPVRNFMVNRRETFEDMGESAAKKQQEAEKLKDYYEKKLHSIEEEISCMKEQAEAETAEKVREIEQEAREHAQRIQEEAQIQAEFERKKIVEEASGEVMKMVNDTVTKMRFDTPSEAYDSFLEMAEKEQEQDKDEDEEHHD